MGNLTTDLIKMYSEKRIVELVVYIRVKFSASVKGNQEAIFQCTKKQNKPIIWKYGGK